MLITRKRTARLRLCAVVAIAVGALGVVAGAARVEVMPFASAFKLVADNIAVRP